MIYIEPRIKEKVINIGKILLEAVRNNNYQSIAICNTDNDDEELNIMQYRFVADGPINGIMPEAIHKNDSGETLKDIYDKYDMLIMLNHTRNNEFFDVEFRLSTVREFNIDADKEVYVITYKSTANKLLSNEESIEMWNFVDYKNDIFRKSIRIIKQNLKDGSVSYNFNFYNKQEIFELEDIGYSLLQKIVNNKHKTMGIFTMDDDDEELKTIQKYFCTKNFAGLKVDFLSGEDNQLFKFYDEYCEKYNTIVMLERKRNRKINGIRHFLCSPKDYGITLNDKRKENSVRIDRIIYLSKGDFMVDECYDYFQDDFASFSHSIFTLDSYLKLEAN